MSTSPISGEWYGFFLAVSYGLTSISITFFNKALLSTYGFPYAQTITLGQVIFSILFMHIMKKFKLLDYPDWSSAVAKQVLPLSLCFLFMVATGLASLALVNIPMFNALRRLSTVLVIVGEYFMLGKVTATDEASSVFLMIFGAMVAGWADLTFDLLGYGLSFVTMNTNLNTFGLMFYNNVLSLPFLFLLSVFLEGDQLLKYDSYSKFGFQLCFFLTCIAAFILNYLIFMCSKVNSPLTTSITGQLKVILTTIIGLLAFNDVKLTLMFGVGLLISTLASVWYSVIKYVQMKQRSVPVTKK